MPKSERVHQLVLPLAFLFGVLVLVFPLPATVVDGLLALNLSAAIVILVTAVMIRTPLEFSVFPTLLLATTLARLVLNVATTRLILSDADVTGLSSAGGIVKGFALFVARDDIIVGGIIFAILVVIQFMVITKGATRISEVGARFALDGMPGRQMAIDADVNAGNIDRVEAQRRRDLLAQEADFHGAMDGASKFLRGDAVAGLFVIGINLVGGLALGVIQGGMSVGQAADVYSKLTIGDGLVS
ncbi:MAG: FHIPEP family type III secretion protein, partial [Planctomycetota bacterium]